MADYAEPLNRDVNLIKTAARYDTELGKWVSDVMVVGRRGTTPVGFEQLVADGTVKILTALEYAAAMDAKLMVEDAEIRYTVDGTDPTTSVGMLGYVSDVIHLQSAAEIAAFKFTRATGTSGKLTCAYGG